MAGSLISEVGLLTNLQLLALDHNHFSGSIPSQLGALSMLRESLDLRSNRFSGTIPTELAQVNSMLQELVRFCQACRRYRHQGTCKLIFPSTTFAVSSRQLIDRYSANRVPGIWTTDYSLSRYVCQPKIASVHGILMLVFFLPRCKKMATKSWGVFQSRFARHSTKRCRRCTSIAGKWSAHVAISAAMATVNASVDT
jgi:hypothetical protein